MSDLMFNEVPVEGKPYYTFGDWKLYAVHDEQSVKGFFGDYRWLSNFEPANCYYMGIMYPSSENAYQAAKLKPHERQKLVECTPAQSKKLWKKLERMDDSEASWNGRRENVMAQILFSKFLVNENLRLKLLDTGDKYLEESNHWKDTFWGVDIKLGGENNLGKMLMRVRNYWK